MIRVINLIEIAYHQKARNLEVFASKANKEDIRRISRDKFKNAAPKRRSG